MQDRSTRTTSRSGLALGLRRLVFALSLAASAGLATGCVTVAELRKVERRVFDLERSTQTTDSRQELADTSAEIDILVAELRELRGRLEVAEKNAADALSEAKKARVAAAQISMASPPGEPAATETVDGGLQGEMVSLEVQAYRDAYSSWREGAHGECIDRFRGFLQTYPSSAYADDAAFWMADCHFKQGDLKNAVLRFDDVVRNYPMGNKAPDALYRQGESLLKLGPGYHEAARRAFERVLKEYPDSARAREARRQLEAIGTG